MPRVIITAEAAAGMERCRRFLASKAPAVAKRAAQAIGDRLRALARMPELGRPHPEAPELRELVIEFGDSGYIALYRYQPQDDVAYILAFRHQHEAGY